MVETWHDSWKIQPTYSSLTSFLAASASAKLPQGRTQRALQLAQTDRQSIRQTELQQLAVAQLPIKEIGKVLARKRTDSLGDKPMCDKNHDLSWMVPDQRIEVHADTGYNVCDRFSLGRCGTPLPRDVPGPQIWILLARLWLRKARSWLMFLRGEPRASALARTGLSRWRSSERWMSHLLQIADSKNGVGSQERLEFLPAVQHMAGGHYFHNAYGLELQAVMAIRLLRDLGLHGNRYVVFGLFRRKGPERSPLPKFRDVGGIDFLLSFELLAAMQYHYGKNDKSNKKKRRQMLPAPPCPPPVLHIFLSRIQGRRHEMALNQSQPPHAPPQPPAVEETLPTALSQIGGAIAG